MNPRLTQVMGSKVLMLRLVKSDHCAGSKNTGLGAARVLVSPSNNEKRCRQIKDNSLVCRTSLFASRFGLSIHHQAIRIHTLVAMSRLLRGGGGGHLTKSSS